ncbi:hypothetical protein HK104_005732, partial [Borealophlyctis nickersoniae]
EEDALAGSANPVSTLAVSRDARPSGVNDRDSKTPNSPVLPATRPLSRLSFPEILHPRPPFADRTSVISSGGLSTTSTESFGFTANDSDGGTGYRYRVRIAHEPNPNHNDEVRLNRGDVVSVWSVFEDAWCEGFNHTTGETGVFPLSCLRNSRKRNKTARASSSVGAKSHMSNRSSVTSVASWNMATMLRSQKRSQSLAYRPRKEGEAPAVGMEIVGIGEEEEESSDDERFTSFRP